MKKFTWSKTIFAKKSPFLAQKLEEKKNCQNPFQTIISLKKEKKKKWHGPLSH